MGKKRVKPPGKLDLRMRLFAAYYVGACRLNGVEAARKAGYVGNDATLAVRASKLLADARVKRLCEERVASVEASTEEILGVLTTHLRGDMGDFITLEGDAAALDLGKAEKRGLLKLIKRFNGEKMSLELYCAQAAAVHLAKIKGLFQDRLKVEHEVTLLLDIDPTGTSSSPTTKAPAAPARKAA